MKISFSTILPALAFVAAATACGDEDFTIISAIGDDTASLADTVDAFKLLLGGVDNLSNPAVAEGFRTINWDAPFVPFEMPGDFFAVNVTRGLSIGSEENEFRVSNPPDDSDNLFDSINPYASQDFSTFSPPRLFSPIKNKKIEITFSPAAQVPAHAATVKGFGAIFVDVDFPDTTKMTALDVDGCEIFSGYVPPNDNGLSFLSIAFRESIIKTIVIKLGDAKLNSDCDEGNGGRDDDDKKVSILARASIETQNCILSISFFVFLLSIEQRR